MRRLVSSVLAAFGLIAVGATGAFAGPVPTAAQAQAAPGKKMCAIADDRLTELSGMVATDDGYVVVNDSTEADSGLRVFYLDRRCRVTNAVPYPSRPLDTEDLALSPDGKKLWIGDIGDNQKKRERIALWSMPVDGSKGPVIHRVSYPDAQFDAEALLINGDGTPIVITKIGGKAGLYAPAAALKSNNDTPVPMKSVGEVTLPKTDTSNPFGPLGRLTVTGAAMSPDGRRVVLRTYADALEWDVPDGDVVKALTSGPPRITPLPDEPWGEAIAYSADGKSFLTVSDAGEVSEDTGIDILRYTPVTKVAKPAGASGDQPKGDTRSWLDKLSLQDINYLIGGVGVLGAILVGAGVFGILRARKRPPPAPDGKDSGRKRAGGGPGNGGGAKGPGTGPVDDDADTALIDPIRDEPDDPYAGAGHVPASGGRGGVYGGSGSGVYGGRPSPPAPPPGGVYGGSPGVYGGGPGSSGVYGGGPGSSGVYGGGSGSPDVYGDGGGRYQPGGGPDRRADGPDRNGRRRGYAGNEAGGPGQPLRGRDGPGGGYGHGPTPRGRRS
jgi:hypothetical protein